MDHFRYRQSAPAGIKALGVVIAAACLAFIAVAAAAADGDWMILIPILGLLIGVGLGVGVTLSHLHVSLHQGQLTLGLSPLWERTVNLKDITAVERIDQVSPAVFGGIGYRRVPRKTGLLWNGGPGVLIRTSADESITIVLDKADALADDLSRSVAG